MEENSWVVEVTSDRVPRSDTAGEVFSLEAATEVAARSRVVRNRLSQDESCVEKASRSVRNERNITTPTAREDSHNAR